MKDLIKIEYPDRTIHNVDCYKFCMSILENGEKVFFIEYKDYGSNTSGEFVDSYGILTNNNGIWYKSDRRIDYYDLHLHVVKEYDPSIIGKNISFMPYSMGSSNHESYSTQTQLQPKKQEVQTHRRNNVELGESASDVLPQTQTETQRAGIPPIHKNNDTYVEATPDESLELQTQTQTQREKIPPTHKNAELREVYISLPSDVMRSRIDWTNLFPTNMRGLSYKGIENRSIKVKSGMISSDESMEETRSNDEALHKISSLQSNFSQEYYDSYIQEKSYNNDSAVINEYNYDVASFDFIDIPEEVISIFWRKMNQLVDNARQNGSFDGSVSGGEFDSIEIKGVTYHFVLDPYYLENNSNTKLDILVNNNTSINPQDIINSFLSQKLPIAELYSSIYYEGRVWEGFTKDREIIKLKEENKKLKEKLLGESTIVEENIANYRI